MQVFNDDGARTDVRIDGFSGAPIVLIHGFPLARDIWKLQAASLSETHRVIRPDLRGMGASGVPDGPYLMETLAGDVAAALDALKIERVTLVGHSLGGYVALAFARMFSERVSALGLVSSRLSADVPAVAAARRELADRIEREGTIGAALEQYVPRLLAVQTAQQLPELAARVCDIAQRTDPNGAAAMLRGMALRAPADDIAPDLEVSVTVIAGARDTTLSIEEARDTAAAFPRGRLIVCKSSGHLPMLEEPQIVTDAIRALASE